MFKKQTLLLAFTGLLAATGSAQTARIVLQGAAGSTVHTDLAAAFTAAQAGDKLYLSGGSFTLAGPYVLDKQVHVIGAGIHPDSSAATSTTTIVVSGGSGAHFFLTTEASGSTFTGLVLNPEGGMGYGTSNSNDDPTGLVFQRCEFQCSVALGAEEGASSSTTFDECVFRDAITGRAGQAVITRSILDGATLNIFRPSGLFLRNSVVLGARLQNSENAIVQNCAFTYDGAPLWQVNGVQINNCLVRGASMFSNSSGNSETNNLYEVTTFFMDDADGVYQFSDDLHLSPSSGGIGGGNDGNDIGLYGTHAPYKAGAMPYNPHFREAAIDPTTNWNGALPVTIRAAAQTH